MHLRPASEEDRGFLRTVYASTRRNELAMTGWDSATCDAFVAMQCDAQERHYRAQFPDAFHAVIERDDKAVGRLWVNHGPNELHVLDISLLPEWRGQGLGTSCLQQLLDRAGAQHATVRLHVEQTNPARHLYERLGFVVTEVHGLHFGMEWNVGAPPNPKTRPQLMEICDEQA